MEDHRSDQDDDVFSFFTTPYDSSSSPAAAAAATPSGVFNRSYSSSSSSSGDESQPFDPSINDTNKRIDYMIQFLDRRLSDKVNFDEIGPVNGGGNGSDRSGSLPEFVGKGGGTGIFKVPIRSAVHPNRPPSLEVRPHPLRESQIGRFLRTMTSTESQLWAGGEDGGVKGWEFTELYGNSGGGEEEDTVPYKESAAEGAGYAVLCMIGDDGSRVVWSGHRDGKIRCWKMGAEHGFEEALSWQAHRGPVLSIAISAYGDIWSGSEGGAIKIWPWESIVKSLSLTTEERHMAALSVERSYIDPRNQVAVNGYTNSLTSDVKYLLSDPTRAKIWSASIMSFALWDARTRDLLKVFNIDGQLENRVDSSIFPDFGTEEEVKMKIVTVTKKDKTQSSLGFFQRSRNALMGAADAVRRAAAKGGLCDDNRRTEAIVISVDGIIWTGSANGALVRWDGNGSRLQEFLYQSSGVLSLCTFGSRLWVGYANGIVQVLDLEGNLLGGWVAHSGPVIKMAVGAGYIFTLANHGGIRGWNVTSPGPLDNVLRAELAGKEFLYTRMENLKILVGTWNVGQGRASTDSLVSWLGSAASGVEIIVVGLQEVEMGAGVLAMSAAKETVGLEGSSLGQWWLDMIGRTLDEGSSFVRIGSRQLAGLLIAVWVRSNLKPHVGDIDAAAVPCGFGRAIGNKGAVGLRLRVYDRIMCFVNCHFAAHLEAVNRRNADFDHVYRTMNFSKQTNGNSGAASASFGVSVPRGGNAVGVNTFEPVPELSEADMVIFLGDLNYRLDDITYDEARDFISQRCFDWLREKDQLRTEMQAGNVFQGMREAVIRFPPTYKFERHQAGLAGYDSGEKKRIPAWCDRILFRDSRKNSGADCSLECPVVSSVSQYDACMDVTDSDHKPVRCVFSLKVARVDESIRRQEFGEIMRSNKKIKVMLGELSKVPETIVSTNNIILQNQDTTLLRVTNKSEKHSAFFQIICEGQSNIKEDGHAYDHRPRGSFGFPRWLEVSPGTGVIKPSHIAEVSIHLEDFPTLEEFVDGVPQNSWCEDVRDEEIILVVKVRGRFSTETRNHRIRVRHCPSPCRKTRQRPDNASGQSSVNVLPRSDYQQFSNTMDMVEQLRNLHSP